MSYQFLAPALAELRDAAEYYESQVTGLGADFLREIELAIDRIIQFPEAWGRISKNFRHCNLRRFPHTIIYTLEETGVILIVSIFHQSRAPMSWRKNLD